MGQFVQALEAYLIWPPGATPHSGLEHTTDGASGVTGTAGLVRPSGQVAGEGLLAKESVKLAHSWSDGSKYKEELVAIGLCCNVQTGWVRRWVFCQRRIPCDSFSGWACERPRSCARGRIAHMIALCNWEANSHAAGHAALGQPLLRWAKTTRMDAPGN